MSTPPFPTATTASTCCPVCAAPQPFVARYPRYVCSPCVERACAPDGRALAFANADFAGGYVARYRDDRSAYDSHDCVIDGMRCVANEARFGGIVVEAV